MIWWCPKCGIVWASSQRPWCRHNAIELPAQRMEKLPSWHPIAKGLV